MNKKIILLLLFPLLFSFPGCREENDEKVSSKEPSVHKEKEEGIISGNIDFSFNIFQRINRADKGKNIVISPYSISTALSMAYLGSNLKTRHDMGMALYYHNISGIDFIEGQKYLKHHFGSADESMDIIIGNSMWIREGVRAKQAFIDKIKDIFDAFVQYLEFDDPSSADVINKWIEKNTLGYIQKLISGPLPGDAFMYLVNAVYFKGKWSFSFDSERTREWEFQNEDGHPSLVEMMYLKNDMYYKDQDSYKVVRIPYGNQTFSMYCVLPSPDIDINAFIETLNQDKWNMIRNIPEVTSDVTLRIPKFYIDYGIRSLNEELKQMGMAVAFDRNADFSEIANDLYISNVLHKAVIEVNEQGTKAAAATVVEISVTSMPMNVPEFVADRPFLFIIADDKDGSILFMGKISGF